jgi:predicted nucleic acid-binding protein
MRSAVCVDASVFVKILIQEPLSEVARQRWKMWTISEGRRIVEPSLFPFEVVAVLRKQVYQGYLTLEMGASALAALLDADIELVACSALHRHAWKLADHFGLPTAYDAHYLALAEMEGCEFWTADGRLYNSVKDEFPHIRWLGLTQDGKL